MRWSTAGLAATMVLLAMGCESSQQLTVPGARAPDIQISPAFEILHVKTLSDKVQVVLDDSGLAHVIIASRKLRSVDCIVVGRQGVVQREVIRESIMPGAIDAAFDKAGNLHVLIDQSHYVRTNGQWQQASDTPWDQAGIKVYACRFVRAEGLVWSFMVSGADIGSPGRWDVYGFGGYGGGLIWPWHSQSEKRVIVPESGGSYPKWFVVEIDSNKDTVNFQAAANRRGRIYAIYDIANFGLAYTAEPRWIRFDDEDVQKTEMPQHRGRFYGISGQLIQGPYDRFGFGSQIRLAADPNSDCALFVKAHTGSWLLRDDQSERFIPLPVRHFWEPRLAAAGKGRFHAVVTGTARDAFMGSDFPVLYLEFSGGQWSAPVELGLANVSSMWSAIWEAVAIGGDGSAALVVWPTRDGIVGRWVSGGQ